MKLLTALSLMLGSASAVLYGDEQFGDQLGGNFWVFNSNGLAIVDPDKCKVIKKISSDNDGNLLPGRWYDGVFMRHDCEGSDKACDYVAINSAVTASDTHGEDAGSGEVLFFDARKKEVVSRVLVGPRPVHSYAVHTQNQYWTHSDGNGFFYVINLDDIDNHTGKPVKVKVDEANHGKLLWDESDLLQGTGYATSTGEAHLFIIDLENEEQIGTYDFSDEGGCFGTHAIGFASANQHLYLECTGPGGTLEFDVSSPRQPVLVKHHRDITGAIYESPDGSHVSITDKGGNKLHLLEPQGTGVASSLVHTIDIEGHPSSPVWYPKSESSASKGSLDYHVCMPLTVNTNQNHYNDSGNLVCDYYGCGPAQNTQDVENGMCLYDEEDRLLTVEIAKIADVQAGLAPYGLGCLRCVNANNYDEEKGLCTCTPECGSCAPNEAKHHDPDLSGVTCLDTSKVVADGRRLSYETTFVPAGSVKQGGRYPYSPECGFGRTYRNHKRGGIYDAVPADYPKPSLQLIDMRDFSHKCQVNLPGTPGRIIYVPPPIGGESSRSLGAGEISGIVIGSLVCVLFTVIVAVKVYGGRGKDEKQDIPGQSQGMA